MLSLIFAFFFSLTEYYLLSIGSGIHVTAHIVSEAGQGESRVDNHFAWAMGKIWKSIISEKGDSDVFDSESACRALCQMEVSIVQLLLYWQYSGALTLTAIQ